MGEWMVAVGGIEDRTDTNEIYPLVCVPNGITKLNQISRSLILKSATRSCVRVGQRKDVNLLKLLFQTF